MSLLLFFCAEAFAGGAVTDDNYSFHWRLSKRAGHIENLDKTVRSEAELNQLEIVLAAKKKPDTGVDVCVSRQQVVDAPLVLRTTTVETTVTTADPADPANTANTTTSTVKTTKSPDTDPDKGHCVTIKVEQWEQPGGRAGKLWVSQGIPVRTAVAHGAEDEDEIEDRLEEIVKPDGIATTTAFYLSLEQADVSRERVAALTYDASVARFEFSLVTHPGMFLGAAVPCADLQEQGLEAPAICEENPANGAIASQLAIAPAGLRIRWAPFNDATWLGFATDVSAGVFGASFEAANGSEVEDPAGSLGLQTTPGSWGVGLDFRVPLAKQTLNLALEGGVIIAPITDETVAFRPAFMLVTSIPIATLIAR